MFKTITAFRIADNDSQQMLSEDSLTDMLPEATAADPDKTSWSRAGFRNVKDTPVYVGADGLRMLVVQVRERVLPGKVIQTAVAATAAEHERRQGYKPGRKQMAEIKDEVVVRLLPTSHIKPVDIPVIVVGSYLMVASGSARQVDVAIEQIWNLCVAKLNDKPRFIPISARRSTTPFMIELLDQGSTDSGTFNCGSSVVLKDGSKTARYKDIDLASQTVRDALAAGLRPVEISAYTERVSFALTESMVIKRIAFNDLIMEQAEQESGEDEISLFDTTLALVTAEIRELLKQLETEIPSQDNESSEKEDEL